MPSNKFPFYTGVSKISGSGSFASRDIKSGEIVNVFGGNEYTETELDDLIEKGKLRIDDDFQIDEDRFMAGPGDDYFTNHSCNPSAGVKNVNQIVAVRDIKKNEEITIDYSTISAPPQKPTKYSNADWIMKCCCASLNCRKNIGFIGTLPTNTLRKYLKLGIIPDFIRKNIKI